MKKFAASVILWCMGAAIAQDSGNNDVMDVQTILDKCGIRELSVQQVAAVEDGRVVSLDLNNRDISKDGIAFIPPEIGKLTALRVFTCSGNIIDSIPSEIGLCTNLQKLDLSSNRIAYINPAIGQLSNLTHLDLRHNGISSVPPELGQCDRLMLLQLWGNKITVLDEAITRLPALEELYLKDNRLTTLPAGIVKLPLRYIDVIGNKICDPGKAIDAWLKKKDNRYRETQKCW